MPEADRHHHPGGRRRRFGGGGGGGGGGGSRTKMTIRLAPKDERTRSSEQIARDLNRQLAGVIPGVIITTRASGGNQQVNRILGGGGDSRIALEIRGDDLQLAQRSAQDAKSRHGQGARESATRASAATTAGRSWRSRSTGRRRRCSGCRSPASPTRSGPASAARRRRSSAKAATSTRSSSGCAKRIASASRTSTTCSSARRGARCCRRRTC